jgi:hypothetical protein
MALPYVPDISPRLSAATTSAISSSPTSGEETAITAA